VASSPLRTHSSSGSPTPFLIGLGVVAAVGAGGGILAWRRRRTV
jgi:LPXTG-motif cell wall-anchored protein